MPDAEGIAGPDVFAGNALPMWIHDAATGRLLDVNAQAVAAYQWSRTELLRSTIDLLATSAEAQQAVAEPTPAFVDGGVHRRKDGSTFDVEVSVSAIEHAGLPARVVIALDVTARKRAAAALTRSERQLADAQQMAHVGSFEWEVDSDSISWSDELYRIYGLRPREFEATFAAFVERIVPEDREHVSSVVRRAIETAEPFEMEERIARPNGEIRILESRGRFMPEQRRLIGVCRDITDLRHAEREREILAEKEREARLRAEASREQITEILERITDAFVALDRNWRYIYVNERATEIFGRSRESLLGKHIWTEFPEGIGQPFHEAYERAMQSGQPVLIEEYYPPWDRWFENRIYPSSNGLAVYFQDVTERRRREDEVRELNDRLARTEAFSLVMVTMVNVEGYFTRVPPTLCRLLDYTHDELVTMHVDSVVHPDDLEADRAHRQRILSGEVRSLDIELRLVRKDGGIVWAYLNCSAVCDSDGRQTHFIVYLRDITERHRAEERIRYQALHDDLTDLPNRVLFSDRLKHAIGHAHRHSSQLAVITIDLDHFKLVNENLGHSSGDIVIRDVAARLRTALRSTDTIARLGSDEFAMIVEDLKSDQQAAMVGAKIRDVFEDRFDIGSHSVRITACAGISVYPRDGHDDETLLRSSESALARAKELGHDTVQLFEESMSARFRERMLLEQELHDAIRNGELLTWYQPILRSSGGMAGVEALVRWNHPRRGVIGPDEFIPLAEESRLIVPIGEWVLRTACADVKRWIDRGADLRLSVNLSVRQFQEMSLLHTIDSILHETSFDPSRLELEVTETVAMTNGEFTKGLLRELRQRNISIAIDDFGVGQTSLIYLRQFPISTIKIDRVFINEILTDSTDAAIVETVIRLAHTLGLTAAAEGVESEEQMKMLESFGCDLFQGFLFSRPVHASEIEAMLPDLRVHA